MKEKDPMKIGMNRTGISMSPAHSKAMVGESAKRVPSSTGDEQVMACERVAYIHMAEPVGTVPPPASVKGAVETAAQAIQGGKASLLLDKLGERLAFERTGTRLYEALLAKYQGLEESLETGISEDALRSIHDEELRHMETVRKAIEDLGGDPTVVTPCADVAGMASSGIVQTLSDPRVSLAQALNSILIAEAGDNEGWQMLIQLAQKLGHEELLPGFDQALREEKEHLLKIRSWLSQMTLIEAGV